jgi:HEAT repeat protein
MNGWRRCTRSRPAAAVLAAAAVAAALLAVAPALGAQPAAQPATKPATPGADTGATAVDDWRQVLAYGIDDEVISALAAMDAVGETALAGEVAALLGRHASGVRIKALEYLGRAKLAQAEPAAVALLAQEPRLDDDLLVAAVRYLEDIASARLGAAARPLVGSDSAAVAGVAVRALRKDPDAGPFLLEKLRDDKVAAELKPDIILALGELKHAPAYDELVSIVEDRSQDKAWRMYAADSLGRIGDKRAVPVLRALYEEDDALLRAYAAAALGRFGEAGIDDLLMDALKDSNWRVRSTGAKALADRKSTAAVEILVYKAKRDPVMRVRLDAVAALGAIGTGEALATVREVYETTGSPQELRTGALEALVTQDLEGSIETIEKVVAGEARREARTSRIVEITASRLASCDSPRLQGLYGRFLEHANANVRAAAVKGIVRNRMHSLRDRVEKASREDPVPGVRREALLALDRL